MRDLDPSSATLEDLARLPPMSKREAQDEWDAIVAEPGLSRAGAERILAEQAWFSYRLQASRCSAQAARVACAGSTSGTGICSSPWTASPGGCRRARSSDRRTGVARCGSRCWRGSRHTRALLYSTSRSPRDGDGRDTCGSPVRDEVLAAVAEVRPTDVVGYASVVGRLARASIAHGPRQRLPARPRQEPGHLRVSGTPDRHRGGSARRRPSRHRRGHDSAGGVPTAAWAREPRDRRHSRAPNRTSRSNRQAEALRPAAQPWAGAGRSGAGAGGGGSLWLSEKGG
jgi:phenylacetate-CoA ligase